MGAGAKGDALGKINHFLSSLLKMKLVVQFNRIGVLQHGHLRLKSLLWGYGMPVKHHFAPSFEWQNYSL
jgi:hypothetical protein